MKDMNDMYMYKSMSLCSIFSAKLLTKIVQCIHILSFCKVVVSQTPKSVNVKYVSLFWIILYLYAFAQITLVELFFSTS